MNFLFTFRIKISHYDIMATNIQQCIEKGKTESKKNGNSKIEKMKNKISIK